MIMAQATTDAGWTDAESGDAPGGSGGRGRGIVRALADTRFTELASARLLRPVYVTALVVAAVVAVIQVLQRVQVGVDALRFGAAAEGIVRILVGVGLPVACWFLVAAGVRMLLEVVVVVLDLYRRQREDG